MTHHMVSWLLPWPSCSARGPSSSCIPQLQPNFLARPHVLSDPGSIPPLFQAGGILRPGRAKPHLRGHKHIRSSCGKKMALIVRHHLVTNMWRPPPALQPLVCLGDRPCWRGRTCRNRDRMAGVDNPCNTRARPPSRPRHTEYKALTPCFPDSVISGQWALLAAA